MTLAQVRAHRRDVKELAELAAGDLRALFRQVGTADEARDALLDTLPRLTSVYGSAAATLGADWYDDMRDAQGIAKRFSAIPATLPDRGRADALARWAVTPLYQADMDFTTARIKATGGLQRIIANADRQTVRESTLQDISKAGWMRVGSGACTWCQQYLDGEVHYVEGYDFDAHDFCGCSVSPVWDESDAEAPQSVITEPEPLTPEPEFVDRLVGALRAGQMTPEQLRTGSLKASALGQRNAEEALKLFQAEREAAQAAKAAQSAKAAVPERFVPKPPNGSVASKVDFQQETLDALLPKGGWTTATRAKTVSALKETPQGRQLLKTMDSFQSGGSTAIPRLRTDIEKYLTGNVGDMPQGRIDAIENFLSAVGRSNAGDRALYRGMSIPGDIEDVAARYKPGDDLDLSLASFSTDKKLAQDFTLKGAGQKVRGKRKTPVLIEWVGEGKRALPIEKLSKSRVFANEKEWVGAGRYAIDGVKRVKRNGVETLVLTIRQKGTW